MKQNIAKLVCFGDGGDTVHYGRGHTCGGHGTPERPHAAKTSDTTLIPDGCPVIDKRPAVATKEGFSWVFKGPMVNVDLDENEIEHCPVPNELFAGAMASSNSFGTLLALQAVNGFNKPKAGPLDSVCISEYIQGWREHGARIGHYQDGEIVWE